MRRNDPRPGQIGIYWISKKPGRTSSTDPFCRTWYDERTRQTRRVSLGTADVREATKALSNWVQLNERPKNTRAEEILIETVLIRYWEHHGKKARSHNSIRLALSRWQQFWTGKTLDQMDATTLDQFTLWLQRNDVKSSTVDRTLSAGRAALKRALKYKEIPSMPNISMTETYEEKLTRPPMGRPVRVNEIAKLLDHAGQRHLFLFILLEANTLARSEALFDLRRSQFDAERNRLNLNPTGRRQNKKFRPIVPVTRYLRPWLEAVHDPEMLYLSHRGKKLASIKTVWERARQDADLPTDLTPYSFRHGIARLLREKKVPLDQIALILGHLPRGNLATTSIYAPMEPEYCTEALAAIEEIMCEVQDLMKSPIDIRDPEMVTKYLIDIRPPSSKLGDYTLGRLEAMLLDGAATAEIKATFGVSSTTVQWHRRRLGLPVPCQTRAGKENVSE